MPSSSEATTTQHRRPQSALSRNTAVNVPLAVVASLCGTALVLLFNKADAAETMAIRANSTAESAQHEMRREVQHFSDRQAEALERIKNIEQMLMKHGGP